MEILCIDDGSTDESPTILQEYAIQDQRIRIITQANGGVSAARNTGLQAARGKYIGFTDPDDFVAPHMFARMCDTALEHDADIVECSGTVSLDDLVVCTTYDYMLRSKHSVDTQFHFSDLDCLHAVLWLKIIRRSLLEKHQLRFDPSLQIGEDSAFLACVLPHCKSIVTIPDRLYFYRPLRMDSITAKYKNREWAIRSFQAHLRAAASIGNYWKQIGCFHQAGASLMRWTLSAMKRTFPKLPRSTRRQMFQEARVLFEQMEARSFLNSVPEISDIIQGRYLRFAIPQLMKRKLLCSRLFISMRNTLLRMVVSSAVQE